MFDRIGIADELIATGIKTIAFQMYAGHKPLFRVPLGGVDAAFPFMLSDRRGRAFLARLGEQ